MSRVRLLSVVGLVAILMTSCTDGGSSDSSGSPSGRATEKQREFDPSATAVIDVDAGRVGLPLDKYELSHYEDKIITDARKLVIARCVKDLGGDSGWKPSPVHIMELWDFGVWRMEVAERYGYDRPMTADARPVEADQSVSPEMMKLLEQCNDTKDVRRFLPELVAPAFDPSEAGFFLDEALATADGKKIHGEWRSCVEGQGLTLDPTGGPFSIAGTDPEPTEENIRIAVLDVQCKDSVNLVQRLADIMAGFEKPLEDKYKPELVKRRTIFEDMLKEAQEYLDRYSKEYPEQPAGQ